MEGSSRLEKVNNLLRCTVREICRLTVPYTSRLIVQGTLSFNVDETQNQDFHFQETLMNVDQERSLHCLTVNQISLLDCLVSEAFKHWQEDKEVPQTTETSNFDRGVSGKTKTPHGLRTRNPESTFSTFKSSRFEKPARNQNGMYQCPLCKKEFSFGTNLTRHERNFHGRPLKRKAKGASGSNSSEGETTTATTTSTASAILSVPTPVLSANSSAQTDSDKHSCSICSQSYSSGTELRSHTRSCHNVVCFNGTLFRASQDTPEMVSSAQRESQHIPISSKTSVFQSTSDSVRDASFAQDTFLNTLTAGSDDDDNDDDDDDNGDDSCNEDSNDYSDTTSLTFNNPNSGQKFQSGVKESKVTDSNPSFCEASLDTKVTPQTSSVMLLSGISSMVTSVSNTVASSEPIMSSPGSLTPQLGATNITNNNKTPCDLPVAILYPSSAPNLTVSASGKSQTQDLFISPSFSTSESHLMSPNTSVQVPSSAASQGMALPVASPTPLVMLPQGLHSPQNTTTQNLTPTTHNLVPIPSGPNQDENNKYECVLCQKTFPLYRNLGRHLKKKHGKRLMDLEMQGDSNRYPASTTHKSGNHQCHLCSHRFTFTSNLRRHMTGVHGYPIQSRKGRRKTGGIQKGKAERSAKTAKGSDNPQDDVNARIRKYECKMCNAAFTFTSNLTRHLKKEHRMMWAKSLKLGDQPKEPSDRATANTTSPIGESQKGDALPHTLKRKQSPDTQILKAAGARSGSSPSSKSPTSASPKTNSPQKSPASRYRFSCGVCGSSFTFRTNLTRHMKKVHGTVPSTTDGSPGEKLSGDIEKKLAHQPLSVK